MKKILKLLLITLITFIMCGCGKKIDKLSYTEFNEYFSNKDGYMVIDNTSKYDINVRRYLEAGEGNIQVFYIEFDTENTAQDYINSLYLTDKTYKIKNYDNYTYVKSTKNRYFKLYQVDNVILNITAPDKKYKKQVNEILKDLGY